MAAGTAFAISKASLRRRRHAFLTTSMVVIVRLFLRRHEGCEGVGVLLRIVWVYHLPSPAGAGGSASTGVVEAGGVRHIVAVPVAELRNVRCCLN